MEFPHLSDTEFPLLNTVDVYSFKNEFDYTRWIPQTEITLCNVLWDSDYNDVVKFDDDTKRDAYFDSLSDTYKQVLETDARVVPEGYVKLPIPYDVLAQYNYMFIDLPIATSPTQLIDYETRNGVRRWYFFINGLRYMAPNTTEVYISFDVWTNFINDIRFKYAMLERGHAPISVTDTDTYLNDPINNCEYLLADDVNFGNSDIVKNTRYIPVGNGEKYICFVLTTDFADWFMPVTRNTIYDSDTPISYYDVTGRQGYQLGVNYSVGFNGYDYSNIKTPVRLGVNSSNDTVLNNVYCVAVKAVDCIGNTNFLSYMRENYPSFFNTVECCFMASDDMIEVEPFWTINNYWVCNVKAKSTELDGITLTKSMFKYPTEAQRFAKLYTSPYAIIELSDDNNTEINIAIETISSGNKAITDFSIAYPYLNARLFFTGIGYSGTDEINYSWRNIKNLALVGETPISDWTKTLFEFDIPTYALFMDGETAWYMRNFNRSIVAPRLNAITAYHTGVRDANTAYENAKNEHYTANVNAKNSINAVKTNADNSALITNVATKRNSSVTSVNNVNNITLMNDSTSVNMARNNASSEYGVEMTEANNGLAKGLNTRKTNLNNDLTLATVNINNDLVSTMASNNMLATAGHTWANSMATLGTGLFSGAAEIAGGNISGAGTAVSGMINAGATFTNGVIDMFNVSFNTNATIFAEQAVADYQVRRNNEDLAYTNSNMDSGVSNNVSVTKRNNYNNNMYDADVNFRSVGTMAANTDNSVNATNYNADDIKNCTNNNAINTQQADDANADNTRGCLDTNSYYTRENAILNLKEILETTKVNTDAALKDARNERPISFGEYSGDMSGDVYTNKGVRIRIKTQDKSAIKQTSDYFARYGYALNQVWDIDTSTLNIMDNFTYWKLGDVWLDDTRASNKLTQKTISDILKKGVTVWSNPTKIGKVNIYDN